MKYIGIGNCDKYNIYILLALISDMLIDSLFGLNSSNSEKPARIFPFKAKIKNHKLLYNFIRSTSILFGGIILYFIEQKNKNKKKEEIKAKKYEILIDYDPNKNCESILFNLIVIGTLFSLSDILGGFIDLIQINLWPLEMLYICIISYWIFKNKICRHKKFAIYIMIVVTIIDIIENMIPTTKQKNLKNINELTDKNVYEIAIIKYGAYSIPLFYLACELQHVQRDYCWVKSKYLMDVKSLSPYKIFLSIGSIGIIFVIIFYSIFSYVPCKTINNINKIEDNYFYNTSEPFKLYLEYCTLNDYDENTKTLYLFFDSIKLIAKEYSSTNKNNMLELFLLIPLYLLFFIVNEISRLMMVRYTDPNNILIYRFFYYFITRLIPFIINKGDEQYMTHSNFILFELEQLAEVLSGLIYIELLELKFWGLDYELKKNIVKRASEDIIKGFEYDNDVDNDHKIEIEFNVVTDQEVYE